MKWFSFPSRRFLATVMKTRCVMRMRCECPGRDTDRIRMLQKANPHLYITIPASSITRYREILQLAISPNANPISPIWRWAPHPHSRETPHRPKPTQAEYTVARPSQPQPACDIQSLDACWTEFLVVMTVLRCRGWTKGEDSGASIRSESQQTPMRLGDQSLSWSDGRLQ
jgi:hypothetical protein